MKSIRAILISSLILLSGCSNTAQSEAESGQIDHRFERITSVFETFYIAYDTETGVEYAVSSGMYNVGNLSVLVDANGKPLVYEGWSKK